MLKIISEGVAGEKKKEFLGLVGLGSVKGFGFRVTHYYRSGFSRRWQKSV